jgi:ABC-2 type transport system ATP-binding protein
MRLRNVSKSYGGVCALDGVDIAFEDGLVHCLAGPNGSGKTTALRLLAGLTRPTAGSVERPDAPGYAFQRPNVYPELTVRENLDVFASMVGADPAWRAALLERLRLGPAEGRVAGELSAGYARKLDLALAMLKEPAALLLDEPFADLDDLTAARLASLLDDYRAPGRTVVVSSHRLERLAGVADRLVVLLDGERVGEARGDGLPAAYADAIAAATGD